MKTLLTIFMLIVALSGFAFAWDGYDYTTGSHIEVDRYDHGGTGEGEVEYYDYESGEYKQGYLDMQPGGSGSLYDYETGEYHDVEMN